MTPNAASGSLIGPGECVEKCGEVYILFCKLFYAVFIGQGAYEQASLIMVSVRSISLVIANSS